MLVIIIASVIDIIGYMLRVSASENFSKYHLRRIPFMWFYYAD